MVIETKLFMRRLSGDVRMSSRWSEKVYEELIACKNSCSLQNAKGGSKSKSARNNIRTESSRLLTELADWPIGDLSAAH